MNRTSRYLASVSLALALLCSPLHAKPKFITFQVPGATATYPRAIAKNGNVIGWFDDQSGFAHGFLRATDGTLTTINAPGGSDTAPIAIQNDGTIVGSYTLQTGAKFNSRGFIRSPDGRIMEFEAPQAHRFTFPASVIHAGWIAGSGWRVDQVQAYFGFLRDPSGHFTVFGEGVTLNCANSIRTTAGRIYQGSQWHGFVRTADGTIAQFDPDGSTYTNVTAINNSGTATGYSQTPDAREGFIRTADGTLSNFAASQDAISTLPNSINKAGAIAGFYGKDNIAHGFVRASDGTITTIDVPGASGTQLYSINDKGEATGMTDLNGVDTGFIWKP